MRTEWESLATDIHKHSIGVRDIDTGRRLANMAACAKDDPKRYAKVNAEAMAPIRKAEAAKREEARAKAAADEKQRQEDMAERMRHQQERLNRAIDQRIAQAGVHPGLAKRK